MLWYGHRNDITCLSIHHEGSRGIWTASVDAFQTWFETRNANPDMTTIFTDTLLYITGEVNDLPQFPNSALHFDIIRIIWPSIILDLIPNSLALTKQTYLKHIGSKITGLK